MTDYPTHSQTESTNPTISTMLAHRSIRKFKPGTIPQNNIQTAMRAGQAAATSSAVQPYCIIHVTDSANRQAIADLAGPQQMVHDCGAFFVICADLRKHMLIVEAAGESYSTGLEAFVVGTVDASLFAQNFTLALESLGYGTCYIGGIRNDLPQVNEILNLPTGVLPLYGLCAGVPDESPSHRPRLEPDAMLFENAYPSDEVTMSAIKQYDEVYKQYLTDRGAKPSTWSEAICKKFSYATRVGLAAFYRSKGASLD
ncbi:MAG: nitroreductase family protein [Phycisphaerales bacterium]|nr:nitroreductase family protein [Phycisphaerales bacterium]